MLDSIYHMTVMHGIISLPDATSYDKHYFKGGEYCVHTKAIVSFCILWPEFFYKLIYKPSYCRK